MAQRNNFANMIKQVLSYSKVKTVSTDLLVNEKSLQKYQMAFTHKSVNCEQNYEVYEFLGDATINKAIVWYLKDRFPFLTNPIHVKMLTRLKINLICKKSFAYIADQLGFWKYIVASEVVRCREKLSLLEDCLEAFIAVTEILVDSIVPGEGYKFCFSIISSLMDKIAISLDYNVLFDAKTRLKELFDQVKYNLGTFQYVTTRKDGFHTTKVVWKKQNVMIELGSGREPLKMNSEMKAAEQSLTILKNVYGIEKPIPKEFLISNK